MDSETVKATSYIQDLLAGIQEAEEERFRKKVGNKDELNAIVVEANVLLSSVEKYEFHCFMAVTELLKLRVNILIAQREEVEELERLEHEKKFFTIKEERTKQQVSLKSCGYAHCYC